MRELLLYTTLGCHLCEQAEQLLTPVVDFLNRSGSLKENDRLVIRPVEIADCTALIERYGVRIPVIQLQGTKSELGWPFDQAQAFEFLFPQLS